MNNIAILSKGSGFSDLIGNQVSSSRYLLIFNGQTFRYDVLKNPLAVNEQMGGKVDFILSLIKQQVSSVFVQTCPVDLKKMLEGIGIRVINSFSGSIEDVIGQLKKLSLEETHIIPTEDIISEDAVKYNKTPAQD